MFEKFEMFEMFEMVTDTRKPGSTFVITSHAEEVPLFFNKSIVVYECVDNGEITWIPERFLKRIKED